MRKLLLAVCALVFLAGAALAAEVTLVKYDPATKKVTVKDGDAEKTYTVTDKTKVVFVDKDGVAKEGKFESAEKVLKNEKAPGKAKFEIITEQETVTEMKFKKRGKGN